jgi:hypothetical protein
MIIRPATLSDRNEILALAYEQAEKYPLLRRDAPKMNDLFTDVVSAARHYSLVAEQNGEVKGVLLAFTVNNAWAQRQSCGVMLWVSMIPGAGAAMLRQFRDWIKSRRAIKVAGFAPDVDLDPRVWKLAERIGFQRHGGAYLLYN